MTAQRRYQRRQREPLRFMLAALAISALSHVIGWALVLGVVMAACSALQRPGGPVEAPSATEPAYEAPAPATERPSAVPAPLKLRPRATDGPRAIEAWDCSDADPDDPEIDPEEDCEPL